MRAKAVGSILEDNDRVTITEWRFAPGAETGWHTHGFDYVVIYRTPAKLTIESKDAVATVEMAEGQFYYRKAGIEHNVVNSADAELVFLELELK